LWKKKTLSSFHKKRLEIRSKAVNRNKFLFLFHFIITFVIFLDLHFVRIVGHLHSLGSTPLFYVKNIMVMVKKEFKKPFLVSFKDDKIRICKEFLKEFTYLFRHGEYCNLPDLYADLCRTHDTSIFEELSNFALVSLKFSNILLLYRTNASLILKRLMSCIIFLNTIASPFTCKLAWTYSLSSLKL
jgi:hypothetical protein